MDSWQQVMHGEVFEELQSYYLEVGVPIGEKTQHT